MDILRSIDLLAGRYVIIDAFDGYVSAMSDLPIVSTLSREHCGWRRDIFETGGIALRCFR